LAIERRIDFVLDVIRQVVGNHVTSLASSGKAGSKPNPCPNLHLKAIPRKLVVAIVQ
jgi:hypothetical protein